MKRRVLANRRGILGAIAALMGNGLTSRQAIGGMARDDAEDTLLLAEKLLNAYPPRQSLASIGTVYWRERDASLARNHAPSAFFRSFLKHIGWTEAELKDASKTHIREQVEAASLQDFSDGRIVRVQGWLLSETEAKLSAIAALNDRRHMVS